MVCGSNMCGRSIPHCGHRKAVQFLNACQKSKQKFDDRTCLNKLLSWSDIVAVLASTMTNGFNCIDCNNNGPCTVPSQACLLCLHSGDKLQHQKHGCSKCGTGPGECCIVVLSDEKFLRLLQEKALSRSSTLAPCHIVEQYFSPNRNNVPNTMKLLKSKRYTMSPDPSTLLTTTMILKRGTTESSKEYIKQKLPKLLARLDLWDTGPRNRYVGNNVNTIPFQSG